MKLKVGDIVLLKSGGSAMTVKKIIDDNITCIWFDKLDELNECIYKEHVLINKPKVNDH